MDDTVRRALREIERAGLKRELFAALLDDFAGIHPGNVEGVPDGNWILSKIETVFRGGTTDRVEIVLRKTWDRLKVEAHPGFAEVVNVPTGFLKGVPVRFSDPTTWAAPD